MTYEFRGARPPTLYPLNQTRRAEAGEGAVASPPVEFG